MEVYHKTPYVREDPFKREKSEYPAMPCTDPIGEDILKTKLESLKNMTRCDTGYTMKSIKKYSLNIYLKKRP